MRTPRPYIKSSLKLDLHLTENVGIEADKVLTDLLQLLSSNGFQRVNTKQERRKKILSGHTSKSDTEKSEDASTLQENCDKKSEKERRRNFGVIGLRSVLKLLNQSNNAGFTSENSLSVILLDSNILKPTAVAHLIALAALGLYTKAADQLPGLRATFHQIGLSPKCSNVDASSSVFATPTIRVPKGKSGDKKKMNSKKKKKEKKRLGKKQ